MGDGTDTANAQLVRLIHGDAPDLTAFDVELKESIDMHQALLDAGYDAEVYIVEGSDHSALMRSEDEAFKLTVEQVMELANEL